jgi:hypothetical protein
MFDSLRFYRTHPVFQKKDNTKTSTKEVSAALKAFASGSTNASPDRQAVWFYLTNHAMAEVSKRVHEKDSLGKYEWIAQDYLTRANTEVTRMFYYLYVICSRESRHLHENGNVYTKIGNKFGEDVKTFLYSIKGKSSTGVYQIVRNNMPDMELGRYTEALQWLFYNGKFSGGYGGPAWGAVADVLKAVCHGEISPEAMMDTGFTLAHNNGPIFNKGMLYDSYTHDLLTLLDVQRAGMMPQLVQDAASDVKYVSSSIIESEHVAYRKKVAETFGDSTFTGYVDWWAVEALGAVKSYPGNKHTQASHYGKPASIAEIEAKAEAAKKAKLEAELAKQAEEAKKWFSVMPGQKVKKLSRDELAA